MIKVFKKNQIIFLTLGLILVTAGYLNYTYTPEQKYRTELTGNIDDSLGDTIYVNAFNEDTILPTDVVEDDEDEGKEEIKIDTYFSQARVQRQNMFDEQIDTYKEILESTTAQTEQKSNAQKKIEEITNLKNGIMIAENLILLKEVEDAVIMTNGKNINVVIKSSVELQKDEVAQIYSIINRELGADINNIQIMLKK